MPRQVVHSKSSSAVNWARMRIRGTNNPSDERESISAETLSEQAMGG